MANLPSPPALEPTASIYRVQPGDTLDVKFRYNPELDDQPVVQPDGRVSLLFAQNVMVANHTVDEVRQILEQEYSRELVKPGISVAIKGPITWRIYVVGEVNTPGMVTDAGPFSVTQAIARAGGLKDSADGTNIVLLRRQEDQEHAFLVDYMEAARGKALGNDVMLASNDVLFVPKTGIADVYTQYNQYFKQFLPNNFGLTYQFH